MGNPETPESEGKARVPQVTPSLQVCVGSHCTYMPRFGALSGTGAQVRVMAMSGLWFMVRRVDAPHSVPFVAHRKELLP